MGIKQVGTWPVPDSFSEQLPTAGQPGSFWENRGDRFHCGADVYAPENSSVLTILSGIVLETGVFTQPETVHYWNRTFFIVVKTETGHFIKYAELGAVCVKRGEAVKAGQIIGTVGKVLNSDLITENDPPYIQALGKKSRTTMLHLECYLFYYAEYDEYLGGNLFIKNKPDNLIDPAQIIHSLKR